MGDRIQRNTHESNSRVHDGVIDLLRVGFDVCHEHHLDETANAGTGVTIHARGPSHRRIEGRRT